MATIEIEWLSDSFDCDQAGCSGGWASGAIVRKDGEPWIELQPRASCYGSEDDWDQVDVFTRILEELGHVVSIDPY